MLSVFICEDNERYRQMVLKCVQNYINMEDLDMEVALCTLDPAEIIQFIKHSKVNGLYFMDIELEGGYNGVNVAKDIRQYDPRGFIAFITSHPQYLSLTFEYGVEALAYINKEEPLDSIHKKIQGCMNNALDRHLARQSEGDFIFKSRSGKKISCLISDILFFETDSPGTKRVILHTKKRQYALYDSLTNIEKKLANKLFYRCHGSYLVNKDSITESCREDLEKGNDCMTMSDGSKCFVSARKKKGLLK